MLSGCVSHVGEIRNGASLRDVKFIAIEQSHIEQAAKHGHALRNSAKLSDNVTLKALVCPIRVAQLTMNIEWVICGKQREIVLPCTPLSQVGEAFCSDSLWLVLVSGERKPPNGVDRR